jgi:hypothetical protein
MGLLFTTGASVLACAPTSAAAERATAMTEESIVAESKEERLEAEDAAVTNETENKIKSELAATE